MGKTQKAALLYILTFVMFFYGYAVARFKVPPYTTLESIVQEIKAFRAGGVLDEETTVLEKLQSDAGLVPNRWIRDYPEGIHGHHVPLMTPGIRDRREPPQVYINDQHKDGYRVIIGAMDFEETMWGAVLISPEGKAVHTWHLSSDHLPHSHPDHTKVLYGSHVLRDGSIIFSMQEKAGGLVKVDVCSNELWSTPGRYHHTVTSDGKGAFWSFTGGQPTLDQNMVKISEETGEILKTIEMAEVRRINSDVHIWHLIYPFEEKFKEISRSANMTHGNDIEPLTEELAENFEQFEEGDLLVNYASINLIFILDPETLEVKWWRVGAADFPHDPDWEADGRITIFNNLARFMIHEKRFSEIVSIDPKTYKSEVIYSGEKEYFSSRYNGRHQLTGYNTRIITSAAQGWAFEIDESGDTVFSFINTYSEEKNESLFLSNALRYTSEYFEGKPWEICSVEN
jgi:hypothetical protein